MQTRSIIFDILVTLLFVSLFSPILGYQTGEVLGDVNGNGVINIIDIALIARAYGSSLGDSRYRPECDLNSDGSINSALACP